MKSVNLKNQGPAEFVIHVQSAFKIWYYNILYGDYHHYRLEGFTSSDVSFIAFNCLYSGSLTRDDDKAN